MTCAGLRDNAGYRRVTSAGAPDPDLVELLHVPVGGASVAVELDASGAPGAPLVVALPAFGVPARKYRRFGAALAGYGVSLATLDYRGTGASRPPVARGDTSGYGSTATQDVPAVLAALRSRLPGSGPLVLLGHSIGAQIAPMYAALHPSQVAALVFTAGGSPFHRGYPWRLKHRPVFGPAAAALSARVLGTFPGERVGFGPQSARFVHDWARLALTNRYPSTAAGEDYRTLMARLRLPLLSVELPGDRLAPPGSAAELLALLPGCEVTRETWPEPLDHVRWLSTPEGIAAHIVAWLATVL